MMDVTGPQPSIPTRESGIVQRVRASLTRAFPDQKPHVLVGYSGGRDSLALAAILADLARTGALTVSLVHVDHAARATSHMAVETAREVAAALAVPLRVVRLDADRVAAHAGVGPEEALRRERYLAFAGVFAACGAHAVALAHHQRDQAETVLLHLLRGAGLDGASGMREWSVIPVPWWVDPGAGDALPVWRPLLGEPFESVASVALATGLPIAEDETNVDPRFRRNAVRRDVLPLLEDVFSGATANVARFGALAAEDAAVLEILAGEALAGAIDEGGAALSRAAVFSRPAAIRRRMVRGWIAVSGFPGELSADRIEAVLDAMARNRSGSRVEIGSGWCVVLNRGLATLDRGTAHRDDDRVP